MTKDVKAHRHAPRTQAERRGATRAALLDACARTLATVGYAATTTTAVAAEAGVSRGALQHTFNDRAELMVAVVAEGYQRMVDDLRLGAGPDGTIAERVAANVSAMLRAYGSPYAIAAYEVLLGERSNAAFMATHAALLGDAEAQLDRMWLETFADSGVPHAALLTARRVARAAVMGLVARSFPLGWDDPTAAAIAPAITALLVGQQQLDDRLDPEVAEALRLQLE